MSAFNERTIAAYLARVTFARKCLLCLPNCSWPGSECDVLAVTANLRVIDVEIKISRADFKADRSKDKWWRALPWQPGMSSDPWDQSRKERRLWPGKVWKHYYCVPDAIWKPELLDHAGSEMSGILLIRERPKLGDWYIHVARMAKPDRNADRLDAADAIDIARLASLRMWDAYAEADALRARQTAEATA